MRTVHSRCTLSSSAPCRHAELASGSVPRALSSPSALVSLAALEAPLIAVRYSPTGSRADHNLRPSVQRPSPKTRKQKTRLQPNALIRTKSKRSILHTKPCLNRRLQTSKVRQSNMYDCDSYVPAQHGRRSKRTRSCQAGQVNGQISTAQTAGRRGRHEALLTQTVDQHRRWPLSQVHLSKTDRLNRIHRERQTCHLEHVRLLGRHNQFRHDRLQLSLGPAKG